MSNHIYPFVGLQPKPRRHSEAIFLKSALTLIIVVVGFSGCRSHDWKSVSISEIVQNPIIYESKGVAIEGILRKDREHLAVYTSEEDAKSLSLSNSLWIQSASSASWQTLRSVPDYSRLVIVGTIRLPKEGAGHLSLWTGQLENIVAVVPIKN